MNIEQIIKKIEWIKKRKEELYNSEQDFNIRLMFLAQKDILDEVLYILENEAH